MDEAPKTDPNLAIRANAAVQILMQDVTTLHARLADMAGELAVARAHIQTLEAKPARKPRAKKRKAAPPPA